MTISRLQAALGMVTNEVTVAAAQINFDFTLVKNEAPQEYHLLGESLSKKRKDEAESGSTHVTARRLGALFQGVCPPTPNLVKAYGIRVSEISSAAKQNAPPRGEKSMFASYIGVDGTSIWAAATSSSAAIQVQLLACMLARLFDASESISIWVEIVEGRRHEVASKFEESESIHFSTLSAAAQAEITRTQLAEWDASARAWLRTADALRIKEQKQLMLILDNVGLPVNDDIRVYSSVLEAWSASLTIMDDLIKGLPQAVETDAAILGLTAWHIYPDMVILGSKNIELCMDDGIVAPSGILTVGMRLLDSRQGGAAKHGIYWSLSLAHLRYYGDPVLTEREPSRDTARITFDQFSHAMFGCIIEYWQFPPSEIPSIVNVISAIGDALQKGLNDSNGSVKELSRLLSAPHWFYLILQSARRYQDSPIEEKDQFRKLFALGQRRWRSCMSYFAKTSTSEDLDFSKIDLQSTKNAVPDAPFFGLGDPATFVSCLHSEENRIRYLRAVALKSPRLSSEDVLIRLWHRDSYIFASGLPNAHSSKHERWIPFSKALEDYPVNKMNLMSSQSNASSDSSRLASDENSPKPKFRRFLNKGQPSRPITRRFRNFSIPAEETCIVYGDRDFRNENRFFLQFNCRKVERFDMVFGHSSYGALFVRQRREEAAFDVPDDVPTEDILHCLRSDMLSLHIQRASLPKMIELSTSRDLEILSALNLIYSDLP